MPATGTIRRIVGGRGFGFIQDEQGQDLFFHHTSVDGGGFDALQEGQQVEFDRERDPRGKGDRATNVRAVSA
jgi:CspA family cold shock protein